MATSTGAPPSDGASSRTRSVTAAPRTRRDLARNQRRPWTYPSSVAARRSRSMDARSSPKGSVIVSSYWRWPSQVVLEIVLAAHPPSKAKHVYRHQRWMERDEHTWFAPEKTGIAHQVVHLKQRPFCHAEPFQIERNPPIVAMVRIEIDDAE